jgi:hypothetical protein
MPPDYDCANPAEIYIVPDDSEFSLWQSGCELVAMSVNSSIPSGEVTYNCLGNDLSVIKFTNEVNSDDNRKICRLPLDDTFLTYQDVTPENTIMLHHTPTIGYPWPTFDDGYPCSFPPNIEWVDSQPSQYCSSWGIGQDDRYFTTTVALGGPNRGSSGGPVIRSSDLGIGIIGALHEGKYITDTNQNAHCPTAASSINLSFGSVSYLNAGTLLHGDLDDLTYCSSESRDLCEPLVTGDESLRLAIVYPEGGRDIIEYGDGDGVYEPGEEIGFDFYILNPNSEGTVTNVEVTIQGASVPHVLFSQASIWIGTLQPGQSHFVHDVRGVIQNNFSGMHNENITITVWATNLDLLTDQCSAPCFSSHELQLLTVLQGAAVIQGLMRPTRVVPVDPLRDDAACLGKRCEALKPDTFLLQAAEESLDHPVLLRAVGRDELLLQAVFLASRPEALGIEDQAIVRA